MKIWKLFIIVCIILSPAFAEAEWKNVKSKDGIDVYTKEIQGKKIHEIKAVASIEASSKDIYKVISDLDNYKNFMPHTKESRLIGKKGKSFIFYSLVDAPMVKKRDYTVLMTPNFDIDNTKGKIKFEWKQANNLGPAPKKGIIRLMKNNGYWLLKPVSESKTIVTYYLATDPGGKIPSWIVNMANKKSVPNIIKAVRRQVKLQ